MKNRNSLIFAAVLCVLAVATLPAASYDDIIADAFSNSTQIANSNLNYENTMLGLKVEEKKDEISWSVTGTVNPYVENVSRKDLGVKPGVPPSFPGMEPPHEFKSISGLKVPVLSASVTLPNDGKTTIKMDAPFAVGYTDPFFRINPSVNVSHTFDFAPKFESNLEDLQDARSHLNAEANLEKTRISFENTLISYFKQFITLEKNMKQSERTLDDKNKAIENMDKLRTATPDSLTYRKAVLDRDKAQRDLDNLKSQKELLMRQYKAVTGLDWDGISDIPMAELDLVIHENGNTSVLASSIDSQIAYENLRKADFRSEPNNLKLGGGISASLDTAASNSYSASVNTTYRIGSNLSFTADVTLPFESNFKPQVPTVSIGGTWSSSPGKGKGMGSDMGADMDLSHDMGGRGSSLSESDNHKKLENSLVVAENNYRDALQSYENDGFALQNEIANYQFTLQKTLDDTEYYREVLELEELSFEKGLNSQKDVDKARFDYEMRQYDEALVKLDGLVLENKIRTYSI